MISKERTAELEHIVIKLDKVLTETGIKDNCCLSPKFRKVFFDDLKEDGWHESIIALCKYISDN
ncbi:MAG: hypothetical protein VB106_05610 [Clostridiaceae bacterium]|nr:hypothetical protein [Clostridiaceae bacterium]